jgi:hypothetical protein
VSSPERVCRAHRFLLKAASETVDRAGSRDQAMRIGVTPNVGRSVAEHNIPSISSWPTYPSINVWVIRNALCPKLIRESIRHSDEDGSPDRIEVPVMSVGRGGCPAPIHVPYPVRERTSQLRRKVTAIPDATLSLPPRSTWSLVSPVSRPDQGVHRFAVKRASAPGACC